MFFFRISLTVAIILAISSGASAQSARVIPTYDQIKSQNLNYVYSRMVQEKVLEKLGHGIQRLVVLPKDLNLRARECGQSNAFFNPQESSVTICYELFNELIIRARNDFQKQHGPEAAVHVAMGAMIFILFHELGHAVVRMYQLPITGREEDVADQFATYVTLNGVGKEAPWILQSGVWFFGSKKTLFYSQRHYADEHSLHEQRKNNIVCWAYGRNPREMEKWAQNHRLTPERAKRCPNEYAQLDHAMRALLGPRLLSLPQTAAPNVDSNIGLPTFAPKEDYSNARAKLLAAGWKPYRSKDADECFGNDVRCKDRPEMLSCSGTGRALCRFAWSRGGKIAVIVTAGEEEPVVVSSSIDNSNSIR